MANFYPDLDEAVNQAEKELEKVQIQDEVTDVVCEQCGRNMVVKYGPHGKSLPARIPGCRNTKPYLEKTGIAVRSVERSSDQKDEKRQKILRL